MKRIHIVGGRNQGKTTLIEQLLDVLRKRGLKVGAIKHSRHVHPVDIPGKDSYRHHQAGGHPWAMISGSTTALFQRSQGGERDYAWLEPHYAGCDLVLVEGHIDATAPRLEVWRGETGEKPLAVSHGGVRVLISDDRPDPAWGLDPAVDIWPRKELEGLADRILGLVDSAAESSNDLR